MEAEIVERGDFVSDVKGSILKHWQKLGWEKPKELAVKIPIRILDDDEELIGSACLRCRWAGPCDGHHYACPK